MTDITSIDSVLKSPTEIVLSERVVTTDFRVSEMHENVANRTVRVDIELGPFVTTIRGDGSSETIGSGRRSILVWQGDAYDAVRDTWNNLDLLAIIPSLL